ncbi:MAG: hypothetical protein C3F15_06960 [Holophagae bacterium]|nr:MAG: hypothetical protein C3F15_06960 [Holophagae bacterium]
MTTRTLAVATVILALATSGGAAERVLADSFPAGGIDAVTLTNRVGDVVITAAEVPEITVDVTLIPRRGGLFSSYRKAEQEVESARLTTNVVNRRLEIEIECEAGEPHFEAQWVVVLPARVSLNLSAGVGDVTIRGAAAGVTIELGVGDATVEVSDGPVELELGVGDATVRGPVARFGQVTASGGVGDATIVAGGQQVTSEGMVGRETSWRGDGPHSIELEVGVGDARVVLE